MTNKTILMTLIIAMTFLIGFSAQEAFSGSPVIYDESLDGPIVNFVGSALPVADDFVIDTETTITDFHVLIAEFPGGFDGFVQYAIYEDDNGLPGDPILGGSGVAQGGVTDDPFSCIGLICFDFWADLETPVPLEPGTYWIEFSGVSFDWGVPLDLVFFGSEAAVFVGIWQPLSEFPIFLPTGVSFSITGEIERIIEVEIDIKPGSFPNSINPRSMGVVPVAILGSDSFNVFDVDVTTLAFGPGGASPVHLDNGAVPDDHYEDVNDDGFTDLVTHYVQKEAEPSAPEACLTGETFDGTLIEGCDSVRLPGNK